MQIGNIGQYLDTEKKIVIALSGGVDSVCLTHFLWKVKKYQIILAHFNHHMRGEESNRDEEFCRDFAEKLGLKIEVGEWKKPEKSEAKAREVRYDFLRKIQKKYQAQAICVAHHQDDQIETVLFNFLRGTGLRGLCGMSIWEHGILRPFLAVSKKEILEYAKKHKLDFCNDSTNQDTTYMRNLLRLEILPKLEKVNSNLGKTLQMNLQNYRQIADFLENEAEIFVKKDRIKLKDFLNLDEAVQTEILRKKMDGLSEPSFKKIEEILKIIHGGKGNKFKEFGKFRVGVNKGEIIF